MKTLILRGLLLWLIFLPAAAIGLAVEYLMGWNDSPLPWWVGLAVWWPLLYLLIQKEGNPTPLGRWLTRTIGPLLP